MQDKWLGSLPIMVFLSRPAPYSFLTAQFGYPAYQSESFHPHVPVTMIIDKYHAIERLNDLVDNLYFYKTEPREKFRTEARRLLDLGKILEMAALIREKAASLKPTKKGKVDKGLEYFTKNVEKMRYGLFQAAGLFVGSGVVWSRSKIGDPKWLKVIEGK